MRYWSTHRQSSKRNNNTFLKWWVISIIIVWAIFFIRNLDNAQDTSDGWDGFLIAGSGSVVIMDEAGKKKDAQNGDVFVVDDSMLSVLSGMIELSRNNTHIWADKWATVDTKLSSQSGNTIELTQWRMWLESDDTNNVELKHISAYIHSGSIVLLEQQKIHSIIYALKWDIEITWNGGQKYTLNTGNKIMVSQSDLVSPGADLQKLTDVIDDSIKQTALFLARNGDAILHSTVIPETNTWDTLVNGSGLMLSGNLNIAWNGGKYISITTPLDGWLIATDFVNIEGKILSTNVSKIMINDQEAIKKGTEWTFSVSQIPMNKDSIDIVYKAYDSGDNLLERGILTLYSTTKKQGTDKLVPTTFPTSDAVYKIISPGENPYKTSNSAVTVSGSVPKGTVEYITVNNFRLKKFIAKSTSWYYYANIAYGTMKDGFNLYEIKFYSSDNTLLSTQLFTIIKEWESSTLSWE